MVAKLAMAGSACDIDQPGLRVTSWNFSPRGYRNQWYQAGDSGQSIVAIGIHGQWLYINPVAEVVIAKMASQPLPLDDGLDRQTLAIFAAIGKVLANAG